MMRPITTFLASSIILLPGCLRDDQAETRTNDPGESRRLAFQTLGEPLPEGHHTIYRTDTFSISTRKSMAYRDAGQDLYFADLSHPEMAQDLSNMGQVIYSDGERAVMGTDDLTDIEELSSRLHQHGGISCGGVRRMTFRPSLARDYTLRFAGVDTDQKIPRVTKLVGEIDSDRIEKTITKLSSFGTRKYDAPQGKEASDWLYTRYSELTKDREDIEVKKVEHPRWEQNSIVVRIKGKENPDDVVIVGSHLDSIAYQGNGLAPGADDNASGTATALEVMEVIVEKNLTFESTVEIHAYAAEEIGLQGSRQIASEYRDHQIPVVAMMQLDMTGYRGQSEEKIWFVSNFTDEGFNNKLGQLVDHYVGVPWDKKRLSGGSSDHESWDREGFVAAFPFENPSSSNPNIHTPVDRVGALDPDYAAKFGQLALAYLSHFAGLAEGENEETEETADPAKMSKELFLSFDLSSKKTRLLGSVPARYERFGLCYDTAEKCNASLEIDLSFKEVEERSTKKRRFFRSREAKLTNKKTITLIAQDDKQTVLREIRFKKK